jgi:hypothetical protein
VPAVPAIRERARRKAAAADLPSLDHRRGSLALWWVMAACIVIVAAISFVVVTPNGLGDWFPVQATTGTPVSAIVTPAPLPIPSPTEAYLAQGRALFAGGKLRDAMRYLDRVPLGDSLRQDADRLRGEIQRELLAVASAETASPAPAAGPSSPPPRMKRPKCGHLGLRRPTGAGTGADFACHSPILTSPNQARTSNCRQWCVRPTTEPALADLDRLSGIQPAPSGRR